MVLNLRRTCFQDLLLLDRCFVCCRLVHKKVARFLVFAVFVVSDAT